MAKKKPAGIKEFAAMSTTPLANIAANIAPTTTPPTPVITVPPGGTLLVIVDVGPMSVPYTVSYPRADADQVARRSGGRRAAAAG